MLLVFDFGMSPAFGIVVSSFGGSLGSGGFRDVVLFIGGAIDGGARVCGGGVHGGAGVVPFALGLGDGGVFGICCM